jgi:sucrose-phosphate synthase
MTDPHNAHFLLAADIDGTLLGDEAGERLFRQFAAEQAGCLSVAYVTGRTCPSVVELVEQGRLPRPRFICSEVGTELMDLDDPANHLGQAFAAQVPPGWSLEEIYRLGRGEGIRCQEFETCQPRFQAGFCWDARPESLQAFTERLSPLDQVYIQTAYDFYIDVLPLALGKGKAVQFLQEGLGLPSEQVVVAGDSGNDRQMFATPFKGILPVNALDELKRLAGQAWHYQSPYPAARGVLDGLHHFGFIQHCLRDVE